MVRFRAKYLSGCMWQRSQSNGLHAQPRLETEEIARLVSNYVLAGIVYEIYVNGLGELRETPKAGEFARPLAFVAKEKYGDVRDFIRAKLDAAPANFFFSPEDQRCCLVEVRSEPAGGSHADYDEKRMLTSSTLDGQEILVAAEPGDDDFSVRYR
ncbi:hypothetical protein ACJA3S_18475 [Pseudomonas sp. KnCO4]|uniref:hypothetical protein n=1 Tax=Pseudomonas sp. KnCO4 TaxID=3381355 RepID=UPI0038779490